MSPRVFMLHVFDYCLAFSASEQSGYRTVEHNRRIGGVTGGPHTHGLGRDVTYDGPRPGPEADTYLAQRGLRRLDEGDHDHIQPTDWTNYVA
jgi:hypothetical protein